MEPTVWPLPRSGGRTLVALLVVSLLLTGCADTGPSPSASAVPSTTAPSLPANPSGASSPAPTPGVPTSPTVTPTAEPASSLSPDAVAQLIPGALAVTVTDDLRVRSQPRVAAESLKFSPLLAKGTQLVVMGGPVEGSGYTWLQVAPVDAALDGGVDSGWVAIADHDGTAWVAPAADPTPGYELASVQVDRPAPRLADAKAAAVAQNAFGIALYKRMLRDPVLNLAGKGVVVSPYSIVTALAMARAGAAGETAAQMDKVLRASSWKGLGTGLNALDQALASRDAAWVDYDNVQHWLTLRTANTVFGQQDYAIKAEYLDRLATTFGAALGLVDFVKDPDAARTAINGWVSGQTLGRIPNLLGKPDVTGDTRLVLVNAVYLKAEWARPFDPEQTQDLPFTTAARKTVKVPTMTQVGDQDIVLAKGAGWRATELRYAGGDGTRPLAMTLILPDNMAVFERSLSPDLLAQVQAKIAAEGKRLQKVTYTGSGDMCGEYPYNVGLYLPRFGIETRASLEKSLAALGMPLAFDDVLADFSGMTAEDKLHIGVVIHQANIDVDEKGTTAAAATAVGMDTGGCTGPSPRTTKTLRFDKPFVYVIRDVGTGAILFMGRVLDPTVRG
jgi:serpin B